MGVIDRLLEINFSIDFQTQEVKGTEGREEEIQIAWAAFFPNYIMSALEILLCSYWRPEDEVTGNTPGNSCFSKSRALYTIVKFPWILDC